MTDLTEREALAILAVRVLHDAGVEWPRADIANSLADAILAAGFHRKPSIAADRSE
jgi:hypothetical protein